MHPQAIPTLGQSVIDNRGPRHDENRLGWSNLPGLKGRFDDDWFVFDVPQALPEHPRLRELVAEARSSATPWPEVPLARCARWSQGRSLADLAATQLRARFPVIEAVAEGEGIGSTRRMSIGEMPDKAFVGSPVVVIVTESEELGRRVPVGVVSMSLLGPGVTALEPSDLVEAAFLRYLLTGNERRLLGAVQVTHDGRSQLSEERMGELVVPLAPLEEQKLIVAVLDQVARAALRAPSEERGEMLDAVSARLTSLLVSGEVRVPGGLFGATPAERISEQFVLRWCLLVAGLDEAQTAH